MTLSDIPPADILMLIPNLGVGGAQRVFADHSRLLGERYRVVDVAFNLDGGVAFPSGNPLVTLEVSGGGGPVGKVMNLARRVAALRRIKRASGARLCISHMPGADYVNLLSKGTERTVAVVHGSKRGDREVAGLSALVQNRLLQPLLYRRADRVVTVSRDIAFELSAFGVEGERIQTINNFFDHQRIEATSAMPLAPEEAALFDRSPMLITSGRLHRQKNHAALLEVFAELRRRRPARLLILGDGDLREPLLHRAEALGLVTWAAWRDGPLRPGADVYLLGARANPFPWLAQSDLYVFPSSWEGFPLALCEAMICGLPVISSDCPTGPREILAPDAPNPTVPITAVEKAPFGLLMPLIDQDAPEESAVRSWVDALGAMLDDPGAREELAAAGRKRMVDFSREAIGRQWFALVDELIGDVANKRR